MKVTKAVITAAGERQRRLPLQTIIDRDGTSRTVLAVLLNEVLKTHIDEVCVVVWPGDEAAYAEAVPEHRDVLRFVRQDEPAGYGDALLRARSVVGDNAFLHLVGDHLYVDAPGEGCAAELVKVAEAESCSVSAVRPTHERLIGSFGVVDGEPVGGASNLYRVAHVVEKPTPTVAEQRFIVPGLRSGHYLAFFGMHVLTSAVLDILADLRRTPEARPTLSDALGILAGNERYLAWQVSAERYDLGAPYGLLTSQLALALSGEDRDEVLALLVNLLASTQVRAPGRQ